MTITLCSSVTFYPDMYRIKQELEGLGFSAVMPVYAEQMIEEGVEDFEAHKTWFEDESQFDKKTQLMKAHLQKVREGDAVLVVNLEKKGISGYIGGNVLLEMFQAWIEEKPIYLLNPVSKASSLYEEAMGMSPIVINGDLSRIGRS